MPSSTSLGSRPSRSTMSAYSSRLRAMVSRVVCSTATSSEYVGKDVRGREIAGDGCQRQTEDSDCAFEPAGPVFVAPHQVKAKRRKHVSGGDHHPAAGVPAAVFLWVDAGPY